jgi:mycothiol synthase
MPIFQMRPYQSEDDYWNIRRFLCQVFLLNERRELSWNVARFDYWRWHYIQNKLIRGPMERVTILWSTPGGDLVGVLHPFGEGEMRIHVHPRYNTPELVSEMFAYAEENFRELLQSGRWGVYTPVFSDDAQRQQILADRGYEKGLGKSRHWFRDLDAPLPGATVAQGYTVRSMGTIEEHPARSWASWRAFHADEGDENYDHDWSWFQNVQSAPLYRRDLDIVATDPKGEICSFCTIYYDDYTRSAVCVLVGTAAEYQRRGLGKAVILEGMRRLKLMGCNRVFATAYEPPAEALYSSVMQNYHLAETWVKELAGERIVQA